MDGGSLNLHGLTTPQFERLLSQLGELKQDKSVNERLLNSFLNQQGTIKDQHLTIYELESKLAVYKKRIEEILGPVLNYSSQMIVATKDNIAM